MTLPRHLADVFAGIDVTATTLSFTGLLQSVSQVTHAARDRMTPEERLSTAAEMFVLNLSPEAPARGGAWGLYFGPTWSLEGRQLLNEVTNEYLDYWAARSLDAAAPALVARYADAAWEFRKCVNGRPHPGIELVRRAMDAYLLCAACPAEAYDRVVSCERALQLAVSVGDAARTNHATLALARVAEEAINNQVHLTIAEVRNARESGVRTDLFVVSAIGVADDGTKIHCSGGRSHILESWTPREEHLAVTDYRYRVPPI